MLLPSLPPTIYRAKGEGGRSLGPSSKEGCGQGGVHPPQGTSEVPSPFRTLPLSYLLRMGLLGLVPLAHIGQGAPPYSPCGPPGLVDPLVDPRTPFGTPGTIPIKCETFPATKIRLPIYKSLPPDHSGTPRDVRDLIRDSEQHSGYCIYISLQP